uniref:ATP synthase subunit 8 n=1 Tax=Mastigoproctus giganteus TaxID=58767 RepID=B1Q0F4_MASGI|nr:ATP synthase subunit 8 [Mastigoproctus giganteus]
MPQMAPMNWVILEIITNFSFFIWLSQFTWLLPTSPNFLFKTKKIMASWYW